MFTAGACLRGAGDTLTPAIAMCTVDGCNILLSGTLARGWFGVPAIGFRGIAIGTTLCGIRQPGEISAGLYRVRVKAKEKKKDPEPEGEREGAALSVAGVGIDAVEVDRFRRVLARTPGLARRLFTDAERAYGERAKDPAPRLAARFAAKEATMKALGVGLGAFKFHDVEVVRAPSGKPGLELRGAAAELASAHEVSGLHLSITHTDRTAEAVVIAT